jgi:hypothetical protein
VTHVSGASAGALVGGFLAAGRSMSLNSPRHSCVLLESAETGWLRMGCAGMAPSQVHDILMNFRREDFWDMGGMGGLLRYNEAECLLIHSAC